jgi:NAD(P)-dependent dehydrogenase (short-subunit alcohol dehydrogenase family)
VTERKRLEGKVAAVTGAGRGLGRAIAIALAQEGAAVVAADITGAEEECARLIVGNGGRAVAIRADVARRPDARGMVGCAEATFGRLDILINNAGVIVNKAFLDLDEPDWDRQFDVIAKGTFLCSQEAAASMVRRAAGGRIVTISSSGGRRPLADEAAYCAAKASVIALTQAMALELAPHGITANVVCPGMIETDMLDAALGEIARRRGVSIEDIKRENLRDVPMGRFGRPEDVAAACVYLASDAAGYVTGACMDITGGWMLP